MCQRSIWSSATERRTSLRSSSFCFRDWTSWSLVPRRRPNETAMLDRGAHGIRASMAACESLSSSSLRGYGAAEAEGVGVFAEGGDAEGDVLFEGDAQLFGAFADVFAADAFGEGLVFHAAFDGIHFQIEDAFRGAN